MHRSTSTARGARHVASGEAHPFRLRTRCRVSPAAASKTKITMPMRARVPIPARPIGTPHTAIMGDAVAIATSPIFEGSVNYPANNEISVLEHRRAVNYPPLSQGASRPSSSPHWERTHRIFGTFHACTCKRFDVERGVQVPVVMHPVLGIGPLPDFEGQIGIPVEPALVPPQHAIISW